MSWSRSTSTTRRSLSETSLSRDLRDV
jgi:hypothetical protein